MKVGMVYNQFRQSLLNYISSKIRSKEDAKDILQSVFAKIASNVNTLAEKHHIQHWLFTVTRNAIIDYYRVNASKKNLSWDEGTALNLFEEESSDPTKGLDQCLHGMIDLLPDDYKHIVIDAELNGIKQKDLAVKYNMPYSSLRSRVQRGRERLKELFLECCHIETDIRGNIIESRSKNSCANSCGLCSED
ncbi:sigma-70 family RNA polymerase sigma factor [Chryseolinea sp. H1M3-3]|uniref:sigma-70 family RNA polymerase sigma factor n=1 Tax=Chryseolinea sp. H1M3-3 TaxID=3034144 RepID=UPI0023EB5EDD|nr:sigma-70 family RNA polymerase sigma factor [Chryseolinea sp. H1M3-3]